MCQKLSFVFSVIQKKAEQDNMDNMENMERYMDYVLSLSDHLSLAA